MLLDKKLLTKSIVYRFYSSLITVIISFIITYNFSIALSIGAADTLIKIFSYYLFDKMWSFEKPNNKRSHIKVRLVENPIMIRNIEHKNGQTYSVNYEYGYQDGYLKLSLGGGTAFKIKCEEKDVDELISPIKKYNMSEGQVYKYCKENNWDNWDYYNEYYSKELITEK